MQRILISAGIALFIHLAVISCNPFWKLEPKPALENDTSITISISHVQPSRKVADIQTPKQVTDPLPPKPVPEKKPAPPLKKSPPAKKSRVKQSHQALPAPIPPKPETKKVILSNSMPTEPDPTMETGSRLLPEQETIETKKNREKESENRVVNQASPAAPKPLGIKENATPLYKKNPLPKYPRLAKQRGHSGTVQLMVLVDEKGVPENIRIFESSGYTSLDEEAVKTVKSWLFEPGTVDGTPQGMWVKIPITFELKK